MSQELGKLLSSLDESIKIKMEMKNMVSRLARIADEISRRFRENRHFYVFGNGGSAADAQHIAAELIGKLNYPRPSLPAHALTTDTSILTAVANDFGYETIFARQIEGLAREGDMAMGISTSGNSANVIAGLDKAREKGCWTLALTGDGGGKMAQSADEIIAIPSRSTQRIQEGHLMVIHLLCERIEETLFPRE